MVKNKKLHIMCFLIFSVTIFAGFSSVKFNLINADKPFIDLSNSVGDSIGNASIAEEVANKPKPEKPIPAKDIPPKPVKVNKPVVTQPPKEEAKPVSVKVTDESIIAMGKTFNSVDSFETELKKSTAHKSEYTLIDDYAESTTYKRVKSILVSLNVPFNEKTNE